MMKLTARTKGLLVSLVGLALVAAPFAIAQYAFANWGDNGAAMLFVMPVSGSLLLLSFWGGLLMALFGIAWLVSTFIKRQP